MLINKENKSEWRFCGIWFDMLDEQNAEKIKARLPAEITDYSMVFIPFEKAEKPMQLLLANLTARNVYNSLDSKKRAPFDEELNLKAQSIGDNYSCAYLNNLDRFIF